MSEQKSVIETNTVACATCPYFRLRADLQELPGMKGAGECRRFPPKVFFNQEMHDQPTGKILQGMAETRPVFLTKMQNQSPMVKDEFFCGEHPQMRADAEADAADARLDALKEGLQEILALPEIASVFPRRLDS